MWNLSIALPLGIRELSEKGKVFAAAETEERYLHNFSCYSKCSKPFVILVAPPGLLPGGIYNLCSVHHQLQLLTLLALSSLEKSALPD